jgi:hypothetical protein
MSGVDAQGLVDAELHREVRDGSGELAGVLVEPSGPRAVLVELPHDRLVGVAKGRIGEQPLPVGGLDVDEELHRVVIPAPVVLVDPGEEPRRLGCPAPPEVVRELAKALDLGRQLDVGHRDRSDVHACKNDYR